MSIMEKLGKAADELESAASEAMDKAKAKYEEKVTPEKRAEIKNRIDKEINNADDRLTEVAQTIGSEIKNFVSGSGNNNTENK